MEMTLTRNQIQANDQSSAQTDGLNDGQNNGHRDGKLIPVVAELLGQTNLPVQANLEAGKSIGAASAANVAHYNAREQIKGHGVRGWFRAIHIITTFAL